MLPSQTAGAGQTVAVVDAYDDPSAESDLATYRSAYGLAPCTAANGCFSRAGRVGGARSPHDDDGWALEVSVDVDMVSAICPQCHILLVEASSDSFEDLAAAENAAVALGATEISNSWAGSEFVGEKSLDPAFAHPGIPITFASGDSGYENHESPVEPNVPSYPAGSPGVIAVGGTTLSAAANTRGWAESAWPHSGGGCSLYEPKPWFQTDSGCSHRMANDVAAVAEHLSIYSSRSWITVGGTSAAAPIIAAVEALASPAARSLGAAAFYQSPSSLFDAASGSNGSCGGSYLCSAGVGYDGPTGVGTPDGAHITGLRLTSVGLAPAPRGTSAVPISTTQPDKRGPGTIVTYTDVHDGTTTFTVQRLVEGRRRGHACVRATRRNAGRAACTRIVTVGAFTRSDSAGTNRFRFTGRVAGRALPPGRYRLRVAPADALGAGQVTYLPFRIRRR